MPAFESKCDKCGAPIKMVKTRKGWIRFELDYYGQSHRCNKVSTKSYSTPIIAEKTIDQQGSSHSSRTTCWWCGESVFYHTNGHGDSVLFDELNPPWPVHPCWIMHKESRSERLETFLMSQKVNLNDNNIPRIYIPIDIRLASDSGIIKLNEIEYFGRIEYVGSPDESSFNILINSTETHSWNCVDFYNPFQHPCRMWFPSSMDANLVKESNLVNVKSRIVFWQESCYLIGSQITRYTEGKFTKQKLAHVGRNLRCRYCGKIIVKGENWGFDKEYKPECRICYDFRNGIDPKEFTRLCRRVFLHGRDANNTKI